MVFLCVFCMHHAAATRGEYLALSKDWWSRCVSACWLCVSQMRRNHRLGLTTAAWQTCQLWSAPRTSVTISLASSIYCRQYSIFDLRVCKLRGGPQKVNPQPSYIHEFLKD